MLSVSALASYGPAPVVSFADRAVAALLTGGGEIASSRSGRPVGELRWLPEELPSGRVRVEVVESPWGSERDAVESAAVYLRGRGYRVLASPRLGRLTICRGRRDAAPAVASVVAAPAALEAA